MFILAVEHVKHIGTVSTHPYGGATQPAQTLKRRPEFIGPGGFGAWSRQPQVLEDCFVREPDYGSFRSAPGGRLAMRVFSRKTTRTEIERTAAVHSGFLSDRSGTMFKHTSVKI